MLIPSYRRQATVLKLAYAHAVMHASRLFLLGSSPSIPASSPSAEYQSHHVEDCIAAAKGVLETVDYMAREGSLFHAFWWTHYVTFTALVVIYVWEIQQQRLGRPVSAAGGDHRGKLLELAERCHVHLARATATNSPSRRYAVILDEFRTTARSQPTRSDGEVSFQRPAGSNGQSNNQMASEGPGEEQQLQFLETLSGVPPAAETMTDSHLLDEWQMTDWLELDSSVSFSTRTTLLYLLTRIRFQAFWTHVDFDESLVWPGIG
jgi:hypothetical protein